MEKVSTSSTEQADAADKAEEALGRMIAYILILGLLVLLARVAIIPFRLARIYLRATRSVRHIREQAKSRFHFWLTESEKHRFKAVYRNLREAESRRERTIQIADDNGIPKDRNGRYNSSTEIGARVLAQMERLDSIIRDAAQEIEREQSRPLAEWAAFNQMLRDKQVSAASLVILVISIYPLTAVILEKLGQGDLMELFAIMLGWCAASAVAGFSYHLLRAICYAPACSIFAKPPQVTLTNIDSWNHQADNTINTE